MEPGIGLEWSQWLAARVAAAARRNLEHLIKNVAIWLVIALVLMTVFNQFSARQQQSTSVEYSQFIEEVKQGNVAKVTIEGRVLKGVKSNGAKFTTYSPSDPWLVSDLLKAGVIIEAKPEEEPSLLMNIFVSWFPMLLLIGVWIFFMRQMQGGGRGGAFSFGKSRARMLDESTNPVTFADVAGLRGSQWKKCRNWSTSCAIRGKFQKLGGRIPRGVLMVGSPGTGKTLLARAIAGEAKVPFFSISGSDFVEMFVGRRPPPGCATCSSRRRNTRPASCSSMKSTRSGRQRGAGLGGGNDEREQTLNQLLVEMDGFETGVGVIVIAATNRPDVLDPALLRPGRFDRQVVVPLPDIRGREQILMVHMRKVPGRARRSSRHPRARHARVCPAADLANLVNEAALFAARGNKRLCGHGRFRARQGQDHDGRGAQVDGHARARAPQHRLSRVRPCGRGEAVAADRSGAQGHHHSARACAGRDHAVAAGKTATAWTASRSCRTSRCCSAAASPKRCS